MCIFLSVGIRSCTFLSNLYCLGGWVGGNNFYKRNDADTCCFELCPWRKTKLGKQTWKGRKNCLIKFYRHRLILKEKKIFNGFKWRSNLRDGSSRDFPSNNNSEKEVRTGRKEQKINKNRQTDIKCVCVCVCVCMCVRVWPFHDNL